MESTKPLSASRAEEIKQRALARNPDVPTLDPIIGNFSTGEDVYQIIHQIKMEGKLRVAEI